MLHDYMTALLPDGWVALFRQYPDLFEFALAFVAIAILLAIVLASGRYGWSSGGDGSNPFGDSDGNGGDGE